MAATRQAAVGRTSRRVPVCCGRLADPLWCHLAGCPTRGAYVHVWWLNILVVLSDLLGSTGGQSDPSFSLATAAAPGLLDRGRLAREVCRCADACGVVRWRSSASRRRRLTWATAWRCSRRRSSRPGPAPRCSPLHTSVTVRRPRSCPPVPQPPGSPSGGRGAGALSGGTNEFASSVRPRTACERRRCAPPLWHWCQVTGMPSNDGYGTMEPRVMR